MGDYPYIETKEPAEIETAELEAELNRLSMIENAVQNRLEAVKNELRSRSEAPE